MAPGNPLGSRNPFIMLRQQDAASYQISHPVRPALGDFLSVGALLLALFSFKNDSHNNKKMNFLQTTPPSPPLPASAHVAKECIGALTARRWLLLLHPPSRQSGERRLLQRRLGLMSEFVFFCHGGFTP